MSRVESLVREHCPHGVEFRALGDVGELIRGRRFTKADYVPEGLGSIHYGEIYTDYGTSTAAVRSHVRRELASSLRLAKPGDLVIAATGENVEEVGKAVAWLGEDVVAVHDDCYIFRHDMNPRFVSYFFQTSSFHAQKIRFVTDSKLARLPGAGLASIQMPVPPLEVQREVVDILDEFERLEADLQGELEAELEARTRQYEHYRSALLRRVDATPVAVATLGTWVGGMTPSKSNPAFWDSGDIPWLASMDVSNSSTNKIRGKVTSAALKQTSLRMVQAPSVVVVMRSNILRRRLPVGLVEVDTTVNQDIRALIPREGVDAKYVFQALRADSELIRLACVRTDGSMAAVDSKRFFAWEVPLPSLDEQRQVADALGNLDSLVRELSSSLPTEVAERRRQYEHYRDRLFTFEEKFA